MCADVRTGHSVNDRNDPELYPTEAFGERSPSKGRMPKGKTKKVYQLMSVCPGAGGPQNTPNPTEEMGIQVGIAGLARMGGFIRKVACPQHHTQAPPPSTMSPSWLFCNSVAPTASPTPNPDCPLMSCLQHQITESLICSHRPLSRTIHHLGICQIGDGAGRTLDRLKLLENDA